MSDDARRLPLLMGPLFGLTALGSASTAIVLPLLSADLGIDLGHASWVLSLYALMLAVATPVYGRASDLVGVRVPLLVGVGLMSSGAMLAAAAPSYGVLLAGRVLQGGGAAAIPTLAVAAVTHTFTARCVLSRWAGWPA